MPIDPRTPVIVGAAALTEKNEDPAACREPLDLMEAVLVRAAEDAGDSGLLAAADAIHAPRGFWAYADPGRILAERFGATGVRTVIAEVGVLQTTMLGAASRAIIEGRSDITLIVGAEARDRATRLQRQGLEVPLTVQEGVAPDELMQPQAEIMGQLEIDLGLITPTIQYAMIDNALRAHEAQSIPDHRRALGALWADFNRVAVDNVDAWNRDPRSAQAIWEEGPDNRMLSFPYTKWLVSQWNVNQAGGLVLCSYEKAQSLGLDASRFIYPLAVVDSEHMVTLSKRADLHRSPGFEHAGRRALEHVEKGIEEIDHLELYSCFPAAVRIQMRELGIPEDRRVTQTGGMTYAGGPLNNFVVQSWVKMVERMREEPGSDGLVTAVSGLITKQGVSLFSAEPERPFLFDQVTDAVRAEQTEVEVVADAKGRGRVATYTVSHARDAASGVAMIIDLDEGRRTLRVVADEDLADRATSEELCGCEVELGAGGAFELL